MNPLQNGALTVVSLKNRFGAWFQLDATATAARARADEILAALKHDAVAAGLAHELEVLVNPPAPVFPAEAPKVRVIALRPFKEFAPGRYPGESEEYSGRVGAVVDVPKSLLRKLGNRVEKASPGAALRPLPLSQDDGALLALDEG